MKQFIYTILLICCGILQSCNSEMKRLEAVLKYSGTNRTELEKVLKHYSQNPADSLKLKSAIFLIENMPGHHTFTGPFLNQYYAKLDSLKDTPYYEKKLFQIIPFEYPQYKHDLQIQEDVKCIKADFLIHNIDLAFRQWQTCPWLSGTDFETFKEYLLPYRVENEPLDYWRDSISHFQSRLKNYTTQYEDCRYSVISLKNKFYVYSVLSGRKIPDPDLQNHKMECIPVSKLQMFVYRTIGIPSAIDFIPHFANRNGRHYWVTAIDPDQNSFQIFQAEIYRIGKIYRRTFSHNPTVTPQTGEYIPAFFRDQFNKDVTDLYLPTTDITVCHPYSIKAPHSYLSVFNDLIWKPIACSRVSGRKSNFPKMGRDVVYLPSYYNENEELCPLTYPVAVYNNGRQQTLQPNKDSVQTLILNRKYPHNSEHSYWDSNLIGARIEVADREDFTNADTLFQITGKTGFQYQYFYPDTTLKKRYWRFINTKRWECHLADLHFYNSENQEMKGKLIGLDSIRAQGIIDDDPLTTGNVIRYLGMDFGQAVSISKIRYLSKNDANGVYPGNDYELLYYDFPDGWISLGIKTATGQELEYNQVPSGALYWLRNLTTGEEERIFTWEKGKARFW